ncbi:SRPBCC family protein [Halopenitus sp. POP-27]|uniref:SRPBCC family protein n=1 Tax=Halopenitus sp. POP-27 TaxID=2994425 RepID=UPI00246878E8|nr:SRPBCC family protein [Halopenitus sp. POP-27]
MRSVTLTRSFDADPASIADAMTDVEPFMAAAGFDEVSVDGDRIAVANRVGIATIELTLERTDGLGDGVADDDPPYVFEYVQREGIFEAMTTTYTVTPTDAGTEVTATTEFALDVAIVGDVLDATVIKRQRRRELNAQFDWLETQGVQET